MVEESVYFVSAAQLGHPIKIGCTRDINRRMTNMQTCVPFPLRLLGSMPGGHEKEQEIHRTFYPYRLQGEWFRRAHKILEYIVDNCVDALPFLSRLAGAASDDAQTAAPTAPPPLQRVISIDYVRGYFDRSCSIDKANRAIVLTTDQADLGHKVAMVLRARAIHCAAVAIGNGRLKLRVSGIHTLQRWQEIVGFVDQEKTAKIDAILCGYRNQARLNMPPRYR